MTGTARLFEMREHEGLVLFLFLFLFLVPRGSPPSPVGNYSEVAAAAESPVEALRVGVNGGFWP